MEFFTKGGGDSTNKSEKGSKEGTHLDRAGIGYGKRSTCFLERTDLHRQ